MFAHYSSSDRFSPIAASYTRPQTEQSLESRQTSVQARGRRYVARDGQAAHETAAASSPAGASQAESGLGPRQLESCSGKSADSSPKQAAVVPALRKVDPKLKREGATVFIKKIRKSTSAETLFAAMSRFGEILYINFPFSKSKKKNYGYGYVIFTDMKVRDFLLNSIKKLEIDERVVVFYPYGADDTCADYETGGGDTQAASVSACRLDNHAPARENSDRTERHTPASDGTNARSEARSPDSPHSIKPTSVRYWPSKAPVLDSWAAYHQELSFTTRERLQKQGGRRAQQVITFRSTESSIIHPSALTHHS